MSGWLKPVNNLENSHIVLVEDKRCVNNSIMFKSKEYKTLLERGEITLVINNKRDTKNITNAFFSHEKRNLSKA